MARGDGEDVDPRMMSVTPRVRYNTIGGINGPLVVLENVGCAKIWLQKGHG